MFETDGEAGLIRLWDCFHGTDHFRLKSLTRETLAPVLAVEVSETLG